MSVEVSPRRYAAYLPEKLTVTNTGSPITLTPPVGATHALIFVEDAPIRFYEDGSTPTPGSSGSGAMLDDGQSYELDMNVLGQFQMIAVSSTATVFVFYRSWP